MSANDNAKLRTWLQVIKTHQMCYAVLGKRLKPFNLSVAQHDLLAAVYAHDGLSQQELAAKLLVVKSNVTVLLTRLEERGLIKRKADKKDARVKRIYLSAEGRRLVKQTLEQQRFMVEDMVSDFEDEEIAQLEAMMRRFRTKLEQMS